MILYFLIGFVRIYYILCTYISIFSSEKYKEYKPLHLYMFNIIYFNFFVILIKKFVYMI